MKLPPVIWGDRVKHSTLFVRSLGGAGGWRSEVVGTVEEVTHLPGDTILVLVRWDGGNGYSEVNAGNLVRLDDVAREARKTENDGVPGLVIGSNAFARLDL